MPDYVTKKRLYHTVDRSEVVEEGDPKAAFLLVGEGDVLSESEVKRLGLEKHFEESKPADPTERTKARLESALARGAYDEALAHKQALERNELAAQSGGPERAALEAGRARQLTGGVPTPPPAERRSSAGAERQPSSSSSATSSEAPPASGQEQAQAASEAAARSDAGSGSGAAARAGRR